MKIGLLTIALGATLGLQGADTWYWLGKVSCKDLSMDGKSHYGYAFKSPDNWENAATGAHGLPKDGDSVIFKEGAGAFGEDFGTSVGFPSVESAGRLETNQGTPTFIAGGVGVKAKSSGSYNSNVYIKGAGEFVFDIPSGNTHYIQKSLYGSADVTLVIKGGGTVRNSQGYAPLNDAKTAYKEVRSTTGGYYPNRKFVFGGVKIQNGALDMRQYYWVRDCNFQFDGNNAALSVNCFDKTQNASEVDTDWGIHSLELSNCKLSETENVTDTTHFVSGQDARCFIHMFGDAMVDQSFSGAFTNYAGLVWDPQTDAEFAFKKTVSSTAGILTVSNGTIRVTEGAGFPKVPTITVSGANAKFKVDASARQVYPQTTILVDNGGKVVSGGRLFVRAVKVDGQTVANGVYSKDGTLGTAADWVDGAGAVVVGDVTSGESAAVAATWNGSGDATTLANWSDAAELPTFNNGSAQVSVAGGSSFIADTDVWVKGFTLDVSPFAFSAAAGKELWIGSEGISASGKAVTLGSADGCVTAAGAQTWTVGGGSLTVNGDVGSVGNGALWIKGSSKNALNLNAATPSWEAPVFITNMVVNFKVSGALGPTGANPAYLYQAPTFAGGITVDRDLWVAETTTITPTSDGDLMFNGFVCSTNGQDINVKAPENTRRIVFNKLMMSRNSGTMSGEGTIVFKDSFHIRDRLSIQGTVTVELHKDGNRLNGNMGTFSGGRLKAMAPYVITKANTIRQAKAGGGCSADGSQNTMINAKSNFILDLNGFDQSIDQLAMHANAENSGGHVTSAKPATLHLQTSKAWWPKHNYTCGFSDTSLSTDDSYGYETADKGYWEDQVTLSYEADAGMVRSMMRTSSSSGNVEVVSGTLVFLRRAKTTNETFDLKDGSANPYYRLANEDGAWPNAKEAVVKGGVLKLEHSQVFGREVNVRFVKTNNAYGKLELAEGVHQKCFALSIDGVDQARGTWGATGSGAQHVDDTRFAGKGVLNVLGDGQGLVIIFR